VTDSSYAHQERLVELTADLAAARVAHQEAEADAAALADALCDLTGWDTFAPAGYMAAARRCLAAHDTRTRTETT